MGSKTAGKIFVLDLDQLGSLRGSRSLSATTTANHIHVAAHHVRAGIGLPGPHSTG